MKIWKNQEGRWTSVVVIKTVEAATAVAFSPTDSDQRYASGRLVLTRARRVFSSLLITGGGSPLG